MEQIKELDYKEAMINVRARLRLKRGYASRVVNKLKAKKLKVELTDVYNVAWGRVKNPVILEALVEEATSTHADPSTEILTRFLKAVA